MILDILIATKTPFLERCAVDAIKRTTTIPYRLWLDRDSHRPHAKKLDRLFANLPDDSEWIFVMDDDAAPFVQNWHDYLICGYDRARFGHTSYVVGCVYRTKAIQGQTFKGLVNPGDLISVPASHTHPFTRILPWYLRGCEAVRDFTGQIVFAHLGGGTVGAGNWRMPRRLWPWFVDFYLWQQGL